MNTQEGDNFDIAIVGAGPAGIMAAITAAKAGARVALLEKNTELSKKLLLAGNGRCNLANAEFNLRALAGNYNEKGGKFLFHAFSVFGPKQTMEFFENLGVKTKIEANKKVFPEKGNAKEVREALAKCLRQAGVQIIFNAEAKNAVLSNGKIEKVELASGKQIKASRFIFCTGGKSYPETGSDGEGFKIIQELGHKIEKLSPALAPIKIKEEWVGQLQGLSLKNVKISVLQGKKVLAFEQGDMIFTHFGISGPAVLNISPAVGKAMQTKDVEISIDFLPDVNRHVLEQQMDKDFAGSPKKQLKNYLENFMPSRMAPVFAMANGFDVNWQLNNISKKIRISLCEKLKSFTVLPEALLGFDVAIVTDGGVCLDEIDHKTMKSKIIGNLYFAGEVIDVAGKTGGFNLQACWSTGFIAGKSAAGK